MGSLLDTAKMIASRQRSSVGDELHEITKYPPGPASDHSPRETYAERVSWWRRAGDAEEFARSLAWSAVAAEWHLLHGRRVPAGVCAGCGELLGKDTAVLLLPHGERAHVDSDDECIIAYGRRWRAAAAAALAPLGI